MNEKALILAIQGELAFEVVEHLITDELPDGNAFLEWDNSKKKCKPNTAQTLIRLKNKFSGSGLQSWTNDQAVLGIGIRTVDNFNKGLAEMTKHTFPAYAFHEQKRYLRRNPVKPRSRKLHCFISRLRELKAYLEEFLPDI